MLVIRIRIVAEVGSWAGNRESIINTHSTYHIHVGYTMVGGLRVLEEMKQDKLETHSKQRTRISLAAAACCVAVESRCSAGVCLCLAATLALAAAC